MTLITLLLYLFCGAVLCLAGYRLFRFTMGLAGFLLGSALGYFIFNLSREALPNKGNGIWLYVFMLVGGILLGYLSFKIYKAALFYVSFSFSGYVLLKSYLQVIGESEKGITGWLLEWIGGSSSVSKSADAAASLPFGSSNLGAEVGNLIDTAASGSEGGARWGIVLLIVLAVALVVAFLVVLFQRPAIILLTAIFGAYIISQNIFNLLTLLSAKGGELEETFIMTTKANPWLVNAVFLAFSLLGILVQFNSRKTHAKG